MKIARFSHEDAIRYGILDDDELVVLAVTPCTRGTTRRASAFALADAVLLAPVIPRSKVVCVGKKYHDHAAEMGGEAPLEPLLFLKPNTSVIGPGDVIVRPAQSERTDFEGELAVVIGRIAKNVPAERAHEVVFGYTIGNDVTARDLQQRDGQWARAKGFDTFCPLGPVIETEFDVAARDLTTPCQRRGATGCPAGRHDPRRARHRGLRLRRVHAAAGDVILTGTPAGIGPFRAGDTVEVEVSGIGVLRNTVRDA